VTSSWSFILQVMDRFTKEYFPMSVLCFLALILLTDLRLTATSNGWRWA